MLGCPDLGSENPRVTAAMDLADGEDDKREEEDG